VISDSRVEAARRVPVEEVARKTGIERSLKRAGSEFVGPCPRCGGTDRFSINRSKQVWHCRGCRTDTGDVIGLVQHLEGCDFRGAVEWLTPDFKEGHSNRVSDLEPGSGTNPTRAEIKAKGKRAGEFEFRDPETNEFRYRKVRFELNGHKTFDFEPFGLFDPARGGSRDNHLLYGGERLADLDFGDVVFVVEGEKKVDRLRELGFAAVSNDSGKESHWLPQHGRLFRGLAVVLWPDSDEPGEEICGPSRQSNPSGMSRD
jgi:CHC2 zinc finger